MLNKEYEGASIPVEEYNLLCCFKNGTFNLFDLTSYISISSTSAGLPNINKNYNNHNQTLFFNHNRMETPPQIFIPNVIKVHCNMIAHISESQLNFYSIFLD